MTVYEIYASSLCCRFSPHKNDDKTAKCISEKLFYAFKHLSRLVNRRRAPKAIRKEYLLHNVFYEPLTPKSPEVGLCVLRWVSESEEGGSVDKCLRANCSNTSTYKYLTQNYIKINYVFSYFLHSVRDRSTLPSSRFGLTFITGADLQL